jgi:hypothetical protein
MIDRLTGEVCVDINPIHQQVIGLDGHLTRITPRALPEQPGGQVPIGQCEFGGFQRNRLSAPDSVRELGPKFVGTGSKGIRWTSVCAALGKVDISVWLVNARHVNTVLGHKANLPDAQ